MSEYQRYEFMTSDRPLTRAQLDEVDALSSHIDASSTHAVIEYHWGDFKHDPIDVLHRYFDGFLYWANWGSPQLAFRFPHGSLPADLIDGYDLDEFVTLTRHREFDILDIHFGEMEAPDEWTDYELGSLMPIRDELMEGDQRALYIAWLASRAMIEGYDEDDDEDVENGDEDEDEGEESSTPPVPPGFGTLTAAQAALAELLQVPQELLLAAARHSKAAAPTSGDDFEAWVKLLPAERHYEYLVRLAHNEPGLSHLFVRELRDLGRDKTRATPPAGERVPYAILLSESAEISKQLERKKREQEREARLRHLQDIHDHQEDYWRQVDMAAVRASGSGYDEAVRLLVELREVAGHFKESQKFQERFRAWAGNHLRRPALVKRLQAHKFTLPEA
ncbi:MAG TPA: hypothetical protein VGT44_15180 [Ktedonobacteraceae bacterium]|nr:hypothetical protein [Ktedonobacteraceae bacterium]